MTDLAAALGRIPSGIFILTARHGERQTGMLASWVMQASFEPPMFTVCVRRERYLIEWLRGGARVALNILSDDEKGAVSHFGRGFAPGEEAFQGIALLDNGAGAPVLAESLGYLAGLVAGSLEVGDHVLFGITVEEGRLLNDAPPMIHVRKNGLNY